MVAGIDQVAGASDGVDVVSGQGIEVGVVAGIGRRRRCQNRPCGEDEGDKQAPARESHPGEHWVLTLPIDPPGADPDTAGQCRS